jgi:hypothetical protein
MRCARAVRRGFFPLDEELQLLAGHYTPTVYEDMTRLATWMPFARAVKEVAYFRQTHVTEATVRRQTEAAGAAYVAVQEHEVARLEHDAPSAPHGPAQQFLSVDGAFVPLVGGEWAEVKTLAIGEVEPPKQVKDETVIQTRALSYFSRLTDATTFHRLALVETHRRGVETAGAVGAVTDGAEWCQSFVDFHRSDAVRILDFPHAGEHLAQIGQAVFGEGTAATDTWFTQHLHQLKHAGPTAVLAEVHQLQAAHADLTALFEPVAYLDKREAHMQSPAFQAAGWPIGDGAVESANKLVVEARLKGSGMHWARPHVDPLLALRNLACNDRWDEGWPQIVGELRRRTQQRSAEKRQQRHACCDALNLRTRPPDPERPEAVPPPSEAALAPRVLGGPASAAKPKSEKPTSPHRPSANHPWRNQPAVLKTKRQLTQSKRS